MRPAGLSHFAWRSDLYRGMSNRNQSRQPKGVPVGGQWRATVRPEGAVALADPADWRPVRIVSVEDTRPIDWASGKRLTGHGDVQLCDRCGKEHEVHVSVLGDDGREHRVGRTCAHATGPLAVHLASLASATGRLAKLEAQLAGLRDWQRRYDATRSGAAPAFPGHVVRPNPHYFPPSSGTVPGADQLWESGDGEVATVPVHAWRAGHEVVDEEATLQELRDVWSHQRALAVAGLRPNVPGEPDLLKRVGAARRRLEELRAEPAYRGAL